MTQAPTPGPLSGDFFDKAKLYALRDQFQEINCTYDDGDNHISDLWAFSVAVAGLPNQTKGRIASGFYRVIERLGGMSDTLSIAGSYGDTLTDEQVADELEAWLSLAPNAPVEASGSEREVPWLTDDECDEVGKLRFALAMKVYRMSSDLRQNLRPQPSGETRADESLDDVARRLFAAQYPGRDYDDLKDMVQIGWLRKAHDEILSARAHPSPTPAADDDRVRIAVEALEEAGAALESAASFIIKKWGTTNPARERAIGTVRQALAALKSEGK